MKKVVNSIEPLFVLMKNNGIGLVKGMFRTSLSPTEIRPEKSKEYNHFNIVFSDGKEYLCELDSSMFDEKASVLNGTVSNFDGHMGGLTMFVPIDNKPDAVVIVVECKFNIPSAGKFMAYLRMEDFWIAKNKQII